MLSNEFVIKQKRSRYLLPKTYSNSKVVQKLFPSPLPSVPHSSLQISRNTGHLDRDKSKSILGSPEQLSKEPKYIDKSAGSTSPLFSNFEKLPTIIKTFASPEFSKVSTIHSSQSRRKSQKTLGSRNQGISSPVYTPHKDFKGILVGQKMFEIEKRIK